MIRQMFSKPEHLNKFVTRQVDPMELFWDLIFVVTLRYIIDSYVADFSIGAFIVGLLVFIEAFIIWTNLSVYSVNFYDVSHNHRLLMTSMLAPLMIVASITDYSQIQSISYLALSLALIKLIQAYIWHRAIAIHKSDKIYQSFNALYRTEVRVYIACACVALLLLVMPQYLIAILLLLICLELLLPKLLNKRQKNQYAFDRILIAERFLLFIILIFGEGFIGIVHIFQHHEQLTTQTLFRGIILFITLYAMFLKLYDEYTIHKERVSTTFMIYLTTYVLSSMLLISALTVLGLWEGEVDVSIQVVSLLGVVTYHLTYAYTAYRYLVKRKQHLLDCDIKYYRKDLIQSLVILIISIIAIILIAKSLILLIILCTLTIYSSAHIKLRKQIVEDIFVSDHEIVELD